VGAFFQVFEGFAFECEGFYATVGSGGACLGSGVERREGCWRETILVMRDERRLRGVHFLWW